MADKVKPEGDGKGDADPKVQPGTQPGAGDPAGTAGDAAGTKAGRTFTQEELDEILADRLKREKESARKKHEAELAKAKEDAEAAKLLEQEQFKTLAEKRAAKVAELESATASQTETIEALTKRAERAEAAIKAQLKAAKEGLPAPILGLIEKLDPVDQMDWLAAHRAELVKANGQAAGIPATPAPSDAAADAAAIERKKREFERTARRMF